MKVSWDASVVDLPLPGRSVVDGDPSAVPTPVDAALPWGRRLVAIPLTPAQGAVFRRYERVRAWGFALACLAIVLAAANLAVMLLVASRGPGFLPLALGAAVLSGVLGSRRPGQYPVVFHGRVTVRRVDRVTAEEWRRTAGDTVKVTQN
ncbi:hypothetical protein [Dactylosporangium sp. CA-233914]|uniref:hypothetical protein n=1 Tax=Dactylosporangium sp. CA-233914 TaxID=3239934 RepID=UPI003D947A58